MQIWPHRALGAGLDAMADLAPGKCRLPGGHIGRRGGARKCEEQHRKKGEPDHSAGSDDSCRYIPPMTADPQQQHRFRHPGTSQTARGLAQCTSAVAADLTAAMTAGAIVAVFARLRRFAPDQLVKVALL